ncbi:hypothetical protein CDD83_1955 [Cordyceps sp. RAO-2017]|nr:hypothetical protein CDD83_1955 [Cordyceps sp. RAO-2017]
MPEGRESPPPERQTGAQMHDPPASGHGVASAERKGEALRSEVEALPSNPERAGDDALKQKFSKKEGN